MSELSVGTLSGLAANSYVIDVASGSSLDLSNGAILPAGSILQVVGASRTTTFSSSSTSYVDLTDVTVTLTPKSASSKFFVCLNVPYARGSTNGSFWYAQVDRNGTALNIPAIQGDYNYYDGGLNVIFLDSPATASAVTYKAQVKVNTGTGTWGGGNITVMEVAG